MTAIGTPARKTNVETVKQEPGADSVGLFRFDDDDMDRHPLRPPTLHQAYAATEFCAWHGATEIAMQIGRRNMAVDQLLSRFSARTAVFVTAWNPHSRPLCRRINDYRQRRLIRYLMERHAQFVHGEGRDPSGAWPPEQSLLVFNKSRAQAARLGRAWGQNAVVYVTVERPPELLMLRACL